MARVIKPPSGHKEVKCQHCLATIAYAPNEVVVHHGTDYTGGPDGDESIKCPGCGGKIILRSW